MEEGENASISFKTWFKMLTLTVSILTPDACSQGVRTGAKEKTTYPKSV
jgi:hypothetical protein